MVLQAISNLFRFALLHIISQVRENTSKKQRKPPAAVVCLPYLILQGGLVILLTGSRVAGAMFCIWCDHSNMMTDEEVVDDVADELKIMYDKVMK